MRRAVASKRPGWIACGAALAFNILILSLQTGSQPGPGLMRTWLMNALTPVLKLVDGSIGGVTGVWDGYFALVGVRDENERLRAENEQLRLEIGNQREDVLEAERLRALLQLSRSGLGKTVVARVIGRDPSHSHHTFTIDKGRQHGIVENASVFTADGVVGRVFWASDRSATVQMITDSQSSVSAMVRSTRAQAVFKGLGTARLQLDYIDDDNQIQEGDELITSGLDQIHPKGLALGVVESVGAPAPPAGILKTVTVRPAADLGRVEEVIVAVERPERVLDPLDSSSTSLDPQRD
jgi:rod shape-determining protein MreC